MQRVLWMCAAVLWMTAGAVAGEAAPEEKTPAEETKAKASTIPLESQEKKVGYAIGLNIGRDMARMGAMIDADALAAGIRDAQNNVPRLDQQQMQAVLMQWQQEMRTKAMAKAQAEGAANLKKGEAFLAANAKQEGVQVTESGLQYKVLNKGEGKSPTARDTVKVHYHGTFIDGQVFDSSVQRGEPAQLSLEQIIPGWKEAIPMMHVGGKWRLYLPAKLAYGERGNQDIPPNSVLIFDVELLDIVKEQPPVIQPWDEGDKKDGAGKKGE